MLGKMGLMGIFVGGLSGIGAMFAPGVRPTTMLSEIIIGMFVLGMVLLHWEARHQIGILEDKYIRERRACKRRARADGERCRTALLMLHEAMIGHGLSVPDIFIHEDTETLEE